MMMMMMTHVHGLHVVFVAEMSVTWRVIRMDEILLVSLNAKSGRYVTNSAYNCMQTCTTDCWRGVHDVHAI